MEQNRKFEQNEQHLQDDLQSYMGTFQLSDSKKQQIWQNIHQYRSQNQSQSRKRFSAAKRVLGTAAIGVGVLFIGVIGVNNASGGRVVESIRQAGGDKVIDTIREFCGIEPESVEIIQNMTPEAQVYAPPLLDCNDTRVIFASSRGMVIYDRIQHKAAATIDLQEIGCNYFTTDTLVTKVLIEGDEISIFNTKDQKAQGNCYRYKVPKEEVNGQDDLSKQTDIAIAAGETQKQIVWNLKPIEITEAEDALLQEWEQKMGRRYEDTFALVDADTMAGWEESKEGSVKYSKDAVCWTAADKKAYVSCLLLKGEAYELYSWNPDTGNAVSEPLPMAVSEEVSRQNQDANHLPQYSYTGDDPIMKAICDYLAAEEKDYAWEALAKHVMIPAPVIFETIKENGEVKVFGNFWRFWYYKNGNTLEEDGGGEAPACIHLKEENGVYKVTKMEKTGDGAYYVKGIQEFCEGYPDIYEKFFDDNRDDQRERIQKESIEQYITDNQLDIQYYHAFGGDPVELFAEP